MHRALRRSTASVRRLAHQDPSQHCPACYAICRSPQAMNTQEFEQFGVMQRLCRPWTTQRLAYQRFLAGSFAACNLVPLCLASIDKYAIRRLSGPQRCAWCACQGLGVFRVFHSAACCDSRQKPHGLNAAPAALGRARAAAEDTHSHRFSRHRAAEPSLWQQSSASGSVTSALQRVKRRAVRKGAAATPSRRRRTAAAPPPTPR